MAQSRTINNKSNEKLDLREEAVKYLRYWPLFLFGILFALGYSYYELRKTTPVYSSTATIIIKDGQDSELAALSELGILSGMNNSSIANEIGIMRSRRMMERVVNELDLHIKYFDENKVRSAELYKNSPFIARVIILDEQRLRNSSGSQYRLTYKDQNSINVTRLSDEKNYIAHLNKPFEFDFATVIFSYNESFSDADLKKSSILLNFHTIKNTAISYRNSLTIRPTDKGSGLIEVSITDPVRTKAENIIDQLILEYNRETIEDKNLIALNTANFIKDRIEIIDQELDSVESGIVKFKESNQLIDLPSEGEIFRANANEFLKQQQQIATQIELAEAMLSYIKNSAAGDLLPANLGLQESAVSTGVNEYNRLVLERNKILSGSTLENPVIVKLDKEIEQLKDNVQMSLKRMSFNLHIEEENLSQEAGRLKSKIAAVPIKEKQFLNIARQQQIKEELYLFLLQKREETSISLAVTPPKAKIVDSALSSGTPVSPNPRSIYLTHLLFGFGIPFAFVYLKNLLNNKVRSKADIEHIVDEIPVVGEIPKIGKNESELIKSNDRSLLAESFRILHTNLQYLLVNTGGKTEGISILITSTVKGEGKTFTAFNLAITIANTGKKVLLVGGDLRNPQLQRYEPGSKEYSGISDYLVNNNLRLEDLLHKSSLHENLHILTSGSIPPNPSELLRQEKARKMFEQLENLYDYVIIDTAPAMLVADTFLTNQYADLTLYMVRAGYTEKKLLNFAADAKKNGKLSEVSFVLNDVGAANFGYGNKYGYAYAYGESRDSIWERMKNKAAIW